MKGVASLYVKRISSPDFRTESAVNFSPFLKAETVSLDNERGAP